MIPGLPTCPTCGRNVARTLSGRLIGHFATINYPDGDKVEVQCPGPREGRQWGEAA